MNRLASTFVLFAAVAQGAMTPIPQPQNKIAGANGSCKIPSGKWDVTSIQFQLVMVDVKDPVWQWASKLPDEYAWATPDGYAMIGQVSGKFGDQNVYGVGI